MAIFNKHKGIILSKSEKQTFAECRRWLNNEAIRHKRAKEIKEMLYYGTGL